MKKCCIGKRKDAIDPHVFVLNVARELSMLKDVTLCLSR